MKGTWGETWKEGWMVEGVDPQEVDPRLLLVVIHVKLGMVEVKLGRTRGLIH